MRRAWVLLVVGLAAVGTAAWVAANERVAGATKPRLADAGGAKIPAGDKSEKNDKSDKPSEGKPAGKPSDSDGSGFTPEREAAALTFVERHHPELHAVLKKLKQADPKAYRTAIRELFRSSERLAASREKLSPEAYELELAAWKAQSRVELLSARMVMGATPELEAELRRALGEQQEVKRQQLELERQRAAKRLDDLDKQLERLTKDWDRLIDERLASIQRRAGQARSSPRLKKPTGSGPPTASTAPVKAQP